jgi:hypothetical protein
MLLNLSPAPVWNSDPLGGTYVCVLVTRTFLWLSYILLLSSEQKCYQKSSSRNGSFVMCRGMCQIDKVKICRSRNLFGKRENKRREKWLIRFNRVDSKRSPEYSYFAFPYRPKRHRHTKAIRKATVEKDQLSC